MNHARYILIALMAICFGSHAEDREITVYSHRHYDIDKQLYKAFEAKTGIKVTLLGADADELIQRLEMEGKLSPADILITADAGRLHLAKSKGLLQPLKRDYLTEHVPAHLRDPDNAWVGLTYRARVVVYAMDRVKPSDLSTYEALTDSKWKNRILIRSSNNIYNQSLLASILVADGKDGATAWAAGMVENFARKPKGSDRDQMKAVAAGQGDIAIVNTYYLGMLLTSSVEAERAVGEGLGVFFPNQAEGERGTHINVSGAGLTKSCSDVEAATQLLEFLLDESSQAQFAQANHEYPVRPGVPPSKVVAAWGSFRPDTLNLSKLGEKNREAVEIFDAVEWR